MSISDLYSSGAHKKNIGHFAGIVKLAKADNVITVEEQKLLDKLAKKLGITQEEYKDILKHPENYPIVSSLSYDDRIERLFNLTEMILADHKILIEEMKLVNRVAIGLGFPNEKVENITERAVHLIIKDYDLEDFTDAIKKVK